MKKAYWFFTIFMGIALLATLTYYLGPMPAPPVLATAMPVVAQNLNMLEADLQRAERSAPVKPGDQACIRWANPGIKKKTPFALVYLHGFTASHEEGMPLHTDFAGRYGMNLYLSRLSGHGLSSAEPFLHLTADSLYDSAKRALEIGSMLGDSVILMATSAGGMLALELAATEKKLPVKALLLYSPCVRIFDPNAWILGGHWGLQLAHVITGSKYLYAKGKDTATAHYWYVKYRIEGAVALQTLINSTMVPQTFRKVTIPVLTLMYYKDPVHQDSTVKTSAIRWMFENLGTKAASRRLVSIPGAGDHVLCSALRSRDLPAVRKASFDFAEQVLGLKPVAGL